MQKGTILGVFVMLVFMLSSVSAAISLTSPSAVYNMGDVLNVNITLTPETNTNGFFISTLSCGSDKVEIFRMPYSGFAGESETFSIKARLDSNLISDLEGTCSVLAEYGSEKFYSSEFKISSLVTVVLDVQGNLFEPGETVYFSGTAVLENGDNVEGKAVIFIVGNNTKTTVSVEDGEFEGDIELPENMASGGYDLRAIVSETLNNDTLNSGSATETLRVKQVVRAVEVALSEVNVNPGKDISYQVVLYDQILGKTSNDVKVIIINPSGENVSENVVSSGITNTFFIETNYKPGEWTVEAESNNIKSTANFYVAEMKNISIHIENTTIFVKNIGNILYDSPLELSIGNEKQTIPLALEVGESKLFKAFAPEGDYDISAVTEGMTTSLGQVRLTGRAVDVRELSSDKEFSFKMLMWVLIAVVLLAIVIVVYRRYRENRMYSSPNTTLTGPVKPKEGPLMGSFGWKQTKPDVKEIRKLSEITLASKEKSDVGRKEECTVISLKVKNSDELNKYKGSEPAINALIQVAGLGKSAKAQVVREGNFTTMVFSQTGTGSANPHIIAVRTGKEIENLLKSHNRKYARKIAFGIGAVTGEMIVERKGSNVNHTSVGTIIPSVKKIAEHANDMLLLGDSTRSKLRGQIKVDKGIGGIYWNVVSFVSHETHNEFIKKFMERRSDETKSF